MHVRKSWYSGTSVRGLQVEKVANEPTSWHRNYNSAMNSALKGLNMQIRKQTSSNSVRHLGMNKKGCTCLINMPYTIQCLLRTANTHTHTHTQTLIHIPCPACQQKSKLYGTCPTEHRRPQINHPAAVDGSPWSESLLSSKKWVSRSRHGHTPHLGSWGHTDRLCQSPANIANSISYTTSWINNSKTRFSWWPFFQIMGGYSLFWEGRAGSTQRS